MLNLTLLGGHDVTSPVNEVAVASAGFIGDTLQPLTRFPRAAIWAVARTDYVCRRRRRCLFTNYDMLPVLSIHHNCDSAKIRQVN